MKELIGQYITEWGWITTVAIISFTFKDMIANFVIGIQFLWGNDFNVDDIVYIKGAKKARIVRQNIYKTTFYVFGHNRKFVVPNNRLWTLEIEKEIPKEDETPENFPII